ncbi:MAG: GNAT family N-acetyltransferase, partial [Lysinibacillus sp.]
MDYANIKDVQKIAKISWNNTYEGIIPLSIQNSFLQNAYSDEMMKQRLENSYMYVAQVEGEIVGFANFSRVDADGI